MCLIKIINRSFGITTSGQISNIQEQESFLIKEQADTNKTQDASKSKHFALHSAFMHAEKYIKELITVESANLKSTFIKTAIAVGGIATICMAFDKQEMLSRSSHLIAETSNFLWTYAADSTFLTIDGAAIGMMVSMYNSEKPILSPAMFKEGMKSAFIAASIGLCIGVGLDWVDASPSPQLSAPSAIISPN